MEQFWQWLTLMKEPLTEVKKAPEPEPVLVATTPAPPPANPNPNEAVNAEKEEKRSNGAHTPVWALSELWSFWQECETSAIGSKQIRWWVLLLFEAWPAVSSRSPVDQTNVKSVIEGRDERQFGETRESILLRNL